MEPGVLHANKGEFPWAENKADVRERVASFFTWLDTTDFQRVILVSHSCTLAVLESMIREFNQCDEITPDYLMNCQVRNLSVPFDDENWRTFVQQGLPKQD